MEFSETSRKEIINLKQRKENTTFPDEFLKCDTTRGYGGQ